MRYFQGLSASQAEVIALPIFVAIVSDKGQLYFVDGTNVRTLH